MMFARWVRRGALQFESSAELLRREALFEGTRLEQVVGARGLAKTKKESGENLSEKYV